VENVKNGNGVCADVTGQRPAALGDGPDGFAAGDHASAAGGDIRSGPMYWCGLRAVVIARDDHVCHFFNDSIRSRFVFIARRPVVNADALFWREQRPSVCRRSANVVAERCFSGDGLCDAARVRSAGRDDVCCEHADAGSARGSIDDGRGRGVREAGSRDREAGGVESVWKTVLAEEVRELLDEVWMAMRVDADLMDAPRMTGRHVVDIVAVVEDASWLHADVMRPVYEVMDAPRMVSPHVLEEVKDVANRAEPPSELVPAGQGRMPDHTQFLPADNDRLPAGAGLSDAVQELAGEVA
jgi:hypothetical protein